MAGFYRELCEALRDGGCYFLKEGKGDHEIWFSPITNRNVIVDKGVKIKHTANGALKDAGLPKKF